MGTLSGSVASVALGVGGLDALGAATAAGVARDSRLQPFGQRQHISLRGRIELGAQKLGVSGRVAQRSSPVAGDLERLHVPQRDPGIEGILTGEARPPLDGPNGVSARH